MSCALLNILYPGWLVGYELNFVLTDNDNRYENNSDNDFNIGMVGGPTPEAYREFQDKVRA